MTIPLAKAGPAKSLRALARQAVASHSSVHITCLPVTRLGRNALQSWSLLPCLSSPRQCIDSNSASPCLNKACHSPSSIKQCRWCTDVSTDPSVIKASSLGATSCRRAWVVCLASRAASNTWLPAGNYQAACCSLFLDKTGQNELYYPLRGLG